MSFCNNLKIRSVFKNIAIMLVVTSALASSNVFSAWAYVVLSATDVSGVTMHTTHHTVTSAHNYAVINTKIALPLGCGSLHLNTTTNNATYALLTASLVADKKFQIGIDSSVLAPWDSKSCGINYITLKP